MLLSEENYLQLETLNGLEIRRFLAVFRSSFFIGYLFFAALVELYGHV